ncbi:hypothetical protein [Nitrospira sp. M1]
MANQTKNEPCDNIVMLEVQPNDSWFYEAIDDEGRPIVFLHIRVPGLLPRRAGPFHDKQCALLALDSLLSDLCEILDCQWEEYVQEYVIKRQYHHRFQHIQVEDELGQAYISQTQTQGTKTPRSPRMKSKRKVA